MTNAAAKLDEALRVYDDRTRPDRIARNVWLSEHASLPGALMGRAETLHMLSETRDVFVNGHFAATLVLAIGVINHALVEELQLRGFLGARDPGLEAVLDKSEEHGIVDADWIASIRQLVARRHPFMHLKTPDHEHGLGALSCRRRRTRID